MSEYKQHLTAVEILATSPKVQILKDEKSKENKKLITVTLPGGCFRKGSVIDYGNDNVWLFGDFTDVPEKFQKQGIGTKLTQTFIEEGKKLGAKNLYVEVFSSGGLKLTAGYHGSENLTFHNILTREVLRNMTYEEALKRGDHIRLGVSVSL